MRAWYANFAFDGEASVADHRLADLDTLRVEASAKLCACERQVPADARPDQGHFAVTFEAAVALHAKVDLDVIRIETLVESRVRKRKVAADARAR